MLSFHNAFAGDDYGPGLYLNYVCDGFKLLCFRYLWTWFVITMWTSMYVRYLRTACEMDVTCGLLYWIMYDFGCVLVGLKSFVVSSDYRVYMGSSMTVWSLRWLLLYLCSYKLDGSVTVSARYYDDVMDLLFTLGTSMAQVGACSKHMENSPRMKKGRLLLGHLLRRPAWASRPSWRPNPSRTPGAARSKTDVQVAYRLRFRWSTYRWKDNFITN
jgi:hypothetical protein